MTAPLDPRSDRYLGNVDQGLPLALSARRGDRHYDPSAEKLSDLIEVTLDGERLDQITSYDALTGVIVRPRRDWRGRMLLDRGAPCLETLSGAVEVRWVRERQHG